MRIGNIVRDKVSSAVGLVTEAWIDEADGISVIVEYFDGNYQSVYWSSSKIRSTATLEVINEKDA